MARNKSASSVGLFEDLFDRVRISRKEREADARRTGVSAVTETKRLVELGQYLRADHFDDSCGFLLIQAEVDDDDDELVAAEPGDRIALAHASSKATSNLLQQQIAGVVPLRVVEGLEIIEVEEHQSAVVPAA
jgi:hypothetical protein